MRQAGTRAPLHAAGHGMWEHCLLQPRLERGSLWARAGGRSMGTPEQEAGVALTGG